MTTQRGAANAGGSGDRPCSGPSQAALPPETAQSMPIRRNVRVIDPRGLHPRLIAPFTKAARGFASTVTVWNGDLRADGKSMFDLIMLVVFPDSEVVLEVDGPDAAAAVEALARILAAPNGEDYSI